MKGNEMNAKTTHKNKFEFVEREGKIWVAFLLSWVGN
jgi:hypothetical protein